MSAHTDPLNDLFELRWFIVDAINLLVKFTFTLTALTLILGVLLTWYAYVEDGRAKRK